MANDTTMTIVGNLTADPELRYTRSGLPVANFTVASTPRTFDRQANEWKDGQALFLRCTLWRDPAEHASGSLHKGDRVVVVGRLVQRAYQDRQGNDRTSIELEVDEVGPSLRYATAQVTRVQSGAARVHGGSNAASADGWASGSGNGPQAGAQDSWAPADDDVPW